MRFLRDIAFMLRKDVFIVSEPVKSDSDTLSSLSELRATAEGFISDLLPIFEDVPGSDNDDSVKNN